VRSVSAWLLLLLQHSPDCRQQFPHPTWRGGI